MNLISKHKKCEIMAATLAMMTRATFETHAYECEGKIY